MKPGPTPRTKAWTIGHAVVAKRCTVAKPVESAAIPALIVVGLTTRASRAPTALAAPVMPARRRVAAGEPV